MNAPANPNTFRAESVSELLARAREKAQLAPLPNIHTVSPQQHDLDDARMWRWLMESADRQGGVRVHPKDENGGRRYAFGNPDEE